MRQEYIIYTGGKPEGKVILRGEHTSSPFREFNYKRGERYYIGLDIPAIIAKRVMSYYGGMFTRKVDDSDGREFFKKELLKLIGGHMDRMGATPFEVIGLISEGLIESVSDTPLDDDLKKDVLEMITFTYREVFGLIK